MANLSTFRADTLQPFKPRTGFKGWFKGNPATFSQVPRHNPEVANNIGQLLNQGFQGLQNPYQGFENIANEAIYRNETQGVPSLAERFSAFGPGSQRSSAFRAAMTGQQHELERSLAAMKEQFGQQNRQGLLEQLKLGLLNQPKFEFRGRQGGALENLFGPLLGGQAGQYGGQSAQDIVGILTSLLPYIL